MENNNNQQKKFRIPEDAREFSRMTDKKWKKKMKHEFDSKKELKAAYAEYMLDRFPTTVEFIIRYGYIRDEDVVATKNACFAIMSQEWFIKMLKNEMKHGNKIKNMKIFPIIIREMVQEIDKQNKAMLAEDPNASVYDVKDLTQFASKLLKKRIEEMEEDGIETVVAFEVLSVLPTQKILDVSQYRPRLVFDVLYEMSKTKTIHFDKLMEHLVDREYYPMFITTALRERKDVFSNLNDNQKAFYLEVSNWVFHTMEHELSKNEVQKILETYINIRKRDDKMNKDSARRYSIISLPETDYPKIIEVANKMIVDDDTIKKYL